MHIIATIIPIFVVITIGWIARQRGFIPKEFIGPANRLVFYLAIPVLIFHAISQGSLSRDLNSQVALITLATLILFFLLIWGGCRLVRMGNSQIGTFMQSAYHGNLGYIGLAVAYYFLGDSGLASASIIAGFLMILQNFLSVFILQYYSSGDKSGEKIFEMVRKILSNPVVISALVGILFSALEIPLHPIVTSTLDIISGMALPLALLLIGASLSLLMSKNFFAVSVAGLLKLILLPGLGLLFYRLCGVPSADYLPALILLASPTATIAYVMAWEMNGDTDFAVAAISTNTFASALTFVFWLYLAG